jgi:hypothetical protein
MLAKTNISYKFTALRGKAMDLIYPWQQMTVVPQLESRSISAENLTGEKGGGGKAASHLGPGRKGAPCLFDLPVGSVTTLADITGPGCIRHIWLTVNWTPDRLRNMILRIYWDGNDYPSVECPLGDFFGAAHGRTVHYVSALTAMQEGVGFNTYIPMPFQKGARITVECDTAETVPLLFYQIDYTLGDPVTADHGRLCCAFRRENPTQVTKDFTILPKISGSGRYLGTVVGARPCQTGWWGEGEIKFYLDGDKDWPTICGTGTEDYAGSAWCDCERPALYSGWTIHEEKFWSFYRWHVPDPIYFHKDIRVEMQQIGHNYDLGFYERADDWCATAFWYWVNPQPLPQPLPDCAARLAKLVD